LFYNNATKEVRHGYPTKLWGGANTKINIESYDGNMVFTSGNNSSVMTISNGAVRFTATANLGAVGNVKITGGSVNQILSTDGTGNLSWTTASAAATVSTIVDGTSTVFMDGTNGNVITRVGGTNVLKVDPTGGLTVLSGGIAMAGTAQFGPVTEAFSTITGATGVVVHGCLARQIFNHTSIAANFTVNLTDFSLTTGYATVVTLMLNQGATAYIPNALRIEGTAQTIKWQGGPTAPGGNANKLDAVAFTIFRTGASTYVVTGQLVTYG
jgi:hypothetical protein